MAARVAVLFCLLALAGACAWTAAAGGRNWADAEIRAVTKAAVLGTSVASFAPDSPLTQSVLADGVAAVDAVQHPAPPRPTTPTPTPTSTAPTIVSTIPAGATLSGTVVLDVDAPGREVDHVGFALDGAGLETQFDAPYELELDTAPLADGLHKLSVNVAFAGGGYAIAQWTVTVANAGATKLSPVFAPGTVAVAKWALPAAAPTAAQPTVKRTLYRATDPQRPVTIKQLDAALVGYAGLAPAAREIQRTLQAAGLRAPANTGTEAVARMLGLRLNHPAAQDDLELLPTQPATRAEAAYSFAQVLRLDQWTVDAVQHAADAFTLPQLTTWQQRVLTTAVHYVGYPYIWGGTSPTAETLFGVHSVGGFDCSGFVWRVYKLTPYPGAGGLPDVLRGRTTYQMSGEVPRGKLVAAAKLQPGDVMFFGAHGPSSKPSEVDHAGLYLGNGWFIQSSGEGVTLLPFDGWYAHSFAWGRRPLAEAGLA